MSMTYFNELAHPWFSNAADYRARDVASLLASRSVATSGSIEIRYVP